MGNPFTFSTYGHYIMKTTNGDPKKQRTLDTRKTMNENTLLGIILVFLNTTCNGKGKSSSLIIEFGLCGVCLHAISKDKRINFIVKVSPLRL